MLKTRWKTKVYGKITSLIEGLRISKKGGVL
jgi:hypothetical protein